MLQQHHGSHGRGSSQSEELEAYNLPQAGAHEWGHGTCQPRQGSVCRQHDCATLLRHDLRHAERMSALPLGCCRAHLGGIKRLPQHRVLGASLAPACADAGLEEERHPAPPWPEAVDHGCLAHVTCMCRCCLELCAHGALPHMVVWVRTAWLTCLLDGEAHLGEPGCAEGVQHATARPQRRQREQEGLHVIRQQRHAHAAGHHRPAK